MIMTYEEIFQKLREAIAEAGDCLADMPDEAFREMTWYYLGKFEMITTILKELQ